MSAVPTAPGTARLALLIDTERCTGCKSCEAACKQEHRLGPGESRNKVLWLGDAERAGLSFFTLACQHCERPACLRACPVNPKAIEKDPVTGVVRVNEARCTGCGECVIACPYSAMGFDARGHHAVKCDLCEDRRARGETTACASVCPTRAIRFGSRDALIAEARAEGRTLRDNDDFLLGPATVYLERIRAQASSAALQRPAFIEAPAAQAVVQRSEPAFPYGETREATASDRSVPGGCNICFNCCSATFHFRGERLVRITGNDADPILQGRVCPKSQLTLQLYDSPHRLRFPQKRVGARGEGRFERISWEQALDEIAERLKAVRAAHGPEALALFIGTRTGMLDCLGTTRLFAQLWGTPNHETTDPFCASSKNVAFELTQGRIGSGNSVTETDLGSAQLYVYFGDNQAETRPVYFGLLNGWRLQHGAKMVVVDPRLTATASKADRWLAIRPGTDMALGLALCHHILHENLHDAGFCADWLLGFEEWRRFVFERNYSPEWAAPITGIEAAEIRRLAAEIAAADGCVIFASRGINQQ
jgi:Fe-S-cluster-containing dehydrogenase component